MKFRINQELKTNLTLMIVSVVFVLFLLEIGLRTVDSIRGLGFFSAKRNLVARNINLHPFRTFGPELYTQKDSEKFITSRHGELYPLVKPSNTYRIIVFGGSTSENLTAYKAEGLSFPSILEASLNEELDGENIEVINVAYSAYSTNHSLILLELDVLSWNPDLIIVSHNINDLLVSYWPEFELDYSNKYATSPFFPDFDSIYTLPNVLFQHSELYWFIKAKAIQPFSLSPIQRQSYGSNLDPLALTVFERNLISIISVATAHDIEVILGTQPLYEDEDYFVRHMEFKPYNDDVIYPLHDEFVAHHHAFNESLQNVAEEKNIWFVDNAQIMSENEAYFIDFVHYTSDGVKRLALNYLDFILENNLVE